MKSIKGFSLPIFWAKVVTEMVKALFLKKPLTIDALYAEALVTIPGSDLDIHWKVSGAFLVRLQPGIGFQNTAGSISIPVHAGIHEIKLTAYGVGNKEIAKLKVNVLPKPIAHSPRLQNNSLVLKYSGELNKSQPSENFYSRLLIKKRQIPEIIKDSISFPKNTLSSKPHFIKDSTAVLYKYQCQNINELDYDQAK